MKITIKEALLKGIEAHKSGKIQGSGPVLLYGDFAVTT